MNRPDLRSPRLRLGAMVLAALALVGCGGSSSGNSTSDTRATDSTQVLPVTEDPISNPATAQTLSIDSVLVENNVDPATGQDAPDHLEIALTNTGSTELSGFEVYYTFTDPTDDVSESYYLALPTDFTIPPGETRVAHFDGTGAPDHFPDNQFSLYHTSLNAMEVTVEVSADGVAVQTMTVQKDPGGDENPDE
jgi:hypothetical protein